MIAEFDVSQLLTDNHVTLEDLSDLVQDFRGLLTKNDSLTYRNCHNLTINIDSKINRLSFINCSQIVLKVSEVISGIEIRRCSDMTIKTRKEKLVRSISIRYSDSVEIRIPKKMKTSVELKIERSKNVHLYDFNQNPLELPN